MQYWEYHTVLLDPVPVNLFHSSGWRLKEINEKEQSDWKKTEIYPSVKDFCNLMGMQGWELVSVAYPKSMISDIALYFKRMY